MKNKFLLFITIIAVIGLYTACDPGGDGPPGGNGNGGDPPPIEGFVWIRPGTFTRGSNDAQDVNASPAHQVILTRGFYMSKTQVTQKQYFDLMGGGSMAEYQPTVGGGTTNYGRGDNYPMYYITWFNAVEFCNRFSDEDGLTRVYTIDGSNVSVNWNANGYRLPTEAEWEYACRAGTTSAWSYGDSENGDYMWFSGNAGSTTRPVGTKPANPWGLFDMHGNVWEWCWDRWGSYTGGTHNDPRGPGSGTDRVIRGGSWGVHAQNTRSAVRSNYTPSGRHDVVGFRVVRN